MKAIERIVAESSERLHLVAVLVGALHRILKAETIEEVRGLAGVAIERIRSGRFREDVVW